MQLSKMIHSNSRYLTVQHANGGDKNYNQKGSAAVDRNKIYASRSNTNPVVMPKRLIDIPVQLSQRFD